MNSILALLALAAPQTSPATVTLGTYRFDGRDVPATVSSAPGPIPAGTNVVEQDGEKFLRGPGGMFVRRFRYEGGWSEVRGGYAAAKAAMTASTPEWRVKVFVLPKVDILDLAPSGLARVRRSTMESNEVAQVAESVARFAAMAESAAMGKLRVKIEFEVDADIAYQTAQAGRAPFDEAALKSYLSPRINGGLYAAEDRVYRGPFDSVFVVHGGLCGPTPTISVHDSPATPIAFYAQGPPEGQWALSIALYNGWAEHLAFAARKSGYRLAERMPGWIRETPAEFAQGYRGLRDIDGLPLVPGHDETATEALAAHLEAPPLAPRPMPTPPAGGPVPAELIVPNRAEQEVVASLIPSGDTAASVPVQRNMAVRDVQDPERGAALEIRLSGLVRTGSALLLGQRNGPDLFDAEVHPYLSLFLKATNPEPMNLRIVSADGKPDRLVRLFGSWPSPAEAGDGSTPASIVPTGTGWNPIVVDLKKLGLGKVAAVLLESNEWVGYWDSTQAQFPVILVDDVKVTKSAPGEETPLAQSAESPAMTEARFAAESTAEADAGRIAHLVELLKYPDDFVRLNAARAFTRIKTPLAEAGLIENIRNLDTRVCEAAIDALAFQGGDAAWAALKRAIEIGPFDFTRCFAARALRGQPDTKNVGTLSLMLTSKSWRGRMWAAESIGTMANEPQQMVLMAFLHEIDPAVRLAATGVANAANEEVCKRFLWSAVNDPSDEVRALSCYKLVKSGVAKYASEGLKGVRDESVGMRRRFLQMIVAKPEEAFRPAVRIAVLDASPTVRAEALRAFAALPGPVTKEELGNVASDPDPRVKAGLEVLRKAKAIG